MDLITGFTLLYKYIMLNISKQEALERLALIEDAIFVGGTSEYIQGYKDELNDIDISISNIHLLNEFGYIHKSFDNSFYGLSGNRGFIPLKSVLIDIFIDEVKPQFILVNGFKCQTKESMIELREKTLKYSFNGSYENRLKLIHNLERLKNIPAN